eukprot:gnl/TRDRNA2_/TRDRNA2_196995_c0_seq1.p1 gnl/TRDRNA2_/TRDRNA2_196995_c0~~gnl/TRDRNA2_/TRDRNA2_196995_c0_seq1.p1  ORF type:complete len:734 (+),score=90.60 gnl/TRDRNA2_/TRDRNA2_196995_c0_seq1:77-2203(+)
MGFGGRKISQRSALGAIVGELCLQEPNNAAGLAGDGPAGSRSRKLKAMPVRGSHSSKPDGQRVAPKPNPRGSKFGATSTGYTMHAALQHESHQKPASLEPVEEEVLAAAATLHDDELKPYGRILRKRLVEFAAAAGLGVVDVDMDHLRSVCMSSRSLLVQCEDGGEWSALLVDRPMSFVDVYDSRDVYPQAFWAAFAAYVGGLANDDIFLPGGRYACAQALAQRGLPFFAGRSLGQVCHIVQLAISHRKILGYRNGAVVPYSHSQSMLKDCCAEWKAPCSVIAAGDVACSAGGSQLPVADLDTARACLKEIFASQRGARGAADTLPLSNVKRIFRSRFHLELSETMLGHAKLSGLLQDPRFADLCTVQLLGQGYVVVPKAAQPVAATISLADELPSPAAKTRCSMRPSCNAFGLDQPISSPLVSEHCAVQPSCSAFCTDEPVPTPLIAEQSSMQPSRIVFCPDEPLLIEAMVPSVAFYGDCTTGPAMQQQMPADSAASLPATFFEECQATSALSPCPDFCDGVQCQPHPQAPVTPALSPSTAFFEGHSRTPSLSASTVSSASALLDATTSRVFDHSGAKFVPASTGKLRECGSEGHVQSSRFCPDEPLSFEEAGGPSTGRPLNGASAAGHASAWPALSPSSLLPLGRMVQNTFIHAKVTPPTPQPGRSHSLPRDMGSSRSSWERTCHVLGFRPQAVAVDMPQTHTSSC